MNLSQLQYFRTLAKEEHYEAAQILSITMTVFKPCDRAVRAGTGDKVI